MKWMSCEALSAALALTALAAAVHSAVPQANSAQSVRPMLGSTVAKVVIENADRDKTGPLHIIYSDGVEVIEVLPPKEARTTDDEEYQVGFSDVRVAPDRETVGWTEEYWNCCNSYSIPYVLTLYRSGKIIQRIRQGWIVWGWTFVDGGKKVGVVWGSGHGTDTGDYQLYDVKTGQLLADKCYSSDDFAELARNGPDWAKQLSDLLSADPRVGKSSN